jgi:CPA2 family monovalent cation:H+ antiporter-2
MTDVLLLKSLVVIAACAVAVAACVRVRLPAVIGYLLAGLAIGPHGFNLLAESRETVFLGELGVIFLLFMAGMELSIPAAQAWRPVLIAGSLQVGLTVVAVSGAAMLLQVEPGAAAILGGALAMSSTALVLKQLADQHELMTRHGRLAIGILLFQDLATIPFLVAIGSFQQGESLPLVQLIGPVLAAVGALVVLVFLLRPIFRIILAAVARTKSAELFLLAVLLLALGVAGGMHLAGLAPPIGAFVAGMVIGRSDFRHQAADDIRPFRDALVGLFFVTVGMKIDPAIVLLSPTAVLAFVVALLLGKALLIGMVGAIMQLPAAISTRLALILAHGGEFGLLLLTQAMAAGLGSGLVGQAALFALALTMGIAPLLIQQNGALAVWITGRRGPARGGEEAEATKATRMLNGHVVVCGCGRVGRLVVAVLEAAQIPYVAIESDVGHFRSARRQGQNVVFGDASRSGLLEAAGLPRARAIAITFDEWRAVEPILHCAGERNPGATVIVSAEDERRLTHRSGVGVTILPENLAAGLELASQLLVAIGLDRNRVAGIERSVRRKLSNSLQNSSLARD